MLQVKNIKKQYRTGELVQQALDDVSLNLRDCEFVSILGPSGSGKTTLLNVIGGLDRYDDGDLVINGISTKLYKDKDWDAYRNHTIGFVFQSYNLIPHQTVLANVELALTIGGISGSERRERAKKALEEVGLGQQLHKKPNQMSGGQMQRVAIARALVNDPDILLADEPTGALDSETSIQVMELLKKVAEKRLVVMVTHNPELAEQYSTRIVRLKDGKIIDDSDPFVPENEQPAENKRIGKAKMGFATSLALSFNNLRTKKGRTLLTAFAGSIGIIGIALILSLSTGVNKYIDKIQRDTMSSYPITITAQAMKIDSLFDLGDDTGSDKDKTENKDGAVYASYEELEAENETNSLLTENDLTAFKKYLDDPDSEIHKYLGENGIVYNYDVSFEVFTHDMNGKLLNTNASPEKKKGALTGGDSPADLMASLTGSKSSGAENFSELMKGAGKDPVSAVITDGYDVVYGDWCKEYNEVVLVLDNNNSVSIKSLYQLGVISADEYNEAAELIKNGKDGPEKQFDYKDICGKSFYLVPACDRYEKKDNGTFEMINELDESKLLKNAIELKITGVVKKNDKATETIDTAMAYTSLLTENIINHSNESDIIKAQEASKDTNVLTGRPFDAADDAAKTATAKDYINTLDINDLTSLITMASYMGYVDADAVSGSADADPKAMAQQPDMSKMLETMISGDKGNDFLLYVYDQYLAGATYDDNMKEFGKVSFDAPSSISIYTDSFENKNKVSECIEDYNKNVDDDKKITYTDYVKLITSGITTIVDSISYVLIAFVAVSLIVSCIMIGIITHISVLERTKEIGILRALGASKRNVSQVFNAETFIIGFCAGALGIIVTELFIIPINMVISKLADTTDVKAQLPIISAVVLILISMGITVLGGLIPAKKAAKKDPVIALRTE